MKSLLPLALAVCFVSSVNADVCPGVAQVPNPAPGQSGYSWGTPIRPHGDPCITNIGVEHRDENTWYAGGANGVYVTRDAGATWSHRLTGMVQALLVAQPRGRPEVAYAGVGTQLYGTGDHGKTWTPLRNFKPAVVSALLVSGDVLVVGLSLSTPGQPGGVWIGSLDAKSGHYRSYGRRPTCLITHTLAVDPKSKTLYAGTEICVHKQPYRPPFFRSDDGGVTWTDVGAALGWHAIGAAVPSPDHVYAQLEGGDFFSSPDRGKTWKKGQALPGAPGDSLLMDPRDHARLWGGRANFQIYKGGVLLSTDSGQSFQDVGLDGVTIASLALNGAGTKIYVAAYGAGVYVSPVP